jgi:RNA ligase (TIGR02306 family)
MSYKAIVTRLSSVRPHSNADRVQLATVYGNQIVVGLNSKEGDMGIYFPSDGQLTHEFCRANNLYRESNMNLDPTDNPGMFDVNRRVRAQRFRGEISDGFWIPINCLQFIRKGIVLDEGFEFDELEGVAICSKYINPATVKAAQANKGKKTRVAKTSIMFKEHFDTEHFGKNLHQFDRDQTIIITEKLHGTSGRIGHVQVERDLTLVERIARIFGARVQENEWKYLNGTRRVVLEESAGTQFHDSTIRDRAFNMFNGNLRKGESIFFEIVGYEPSGASIMPKVNTKGLGDKQFTKLFGESMTYSYGCEIGQCDVYVYRMTYTNEDGQSVDYSWDDLVSRCQEIGVKVTPHIRTLTLRELALERDLEDDRDLKREFAKLVEDYGSGKSILDKRHIREGVCVRIENGLRNKTFKFKSFEFKVLEGIVKDSGVIDTEESQG